MGLSPEQKVNHPQKSFHSENFSRIDQLKTGKPSGMGPIGMEDNTAINGGKGGVFAKNSGASAKLNRRGF